MCDHKPAGTIQVDVDELWVYYESLGQLPSHQPRSPVYQEGIPRLLQLFDRYGIRATFFVCGRDVALHGDALREVVRRGHEIANHTLTHPNGFARLERDQLAQEIGVAHERIAEATGQPPAGFKSPGFSFNPAQLSLLAELGYQYDSTLLPTPYAPLLRTLQRWKSGGQVDPSHYGRVVHGLTPLQPYRPRPGRPYRPDSRVGDAGHPGSQSPARETAPHHALWEAPVSTLPLLRVPMHSTFVLSSGQFLFDLGLRLTLARGLSVNYLLHGADVIDAVNEPELRSYAFLTKSWEAKRPLYEHMLEQLAEHYRIMPTQELITQFTKTQGNC